MHRRNQRERTVLLAGMDIFAATQNYEQWLAAQARLLPADLALKHARMAENPFSFLRGTFYRWIQLWPRLCPELAEAAVVLSTADLHVENFGTWRDAEGRLAWGINDFDEAYPLPYTHDLVRLATSALLAGHQGVVVNPDEAVCDAILAGYAKSLRKGGNALVLEERRPWLRSIALGELRDPVKYWAKLCALPTYESTVPGRAREAIERLMPKRRLDYRIVHRQAGLGSLGRERYVALAEWHHGCIAREAKRLAPSACEWARIPRPHGFGRSGHGIYYNAILDRAVRCPDPFVRQRGNWIVRRLAADCSKIEIANLPEKKEELKLFRAMGREVANVHLGSRSAVRHIERDLRHRPGGWLVQAARRMAEAMLADWEAWSARAETSRLRLVAE